MTTKSEAIKTLSDLIRSTINACEDDLEKAEARALITAVLDDVLQELQR